MWTTENPAMVAWQSALKQRGLLTAILSNMGDSVLESVEQNFDWIHRFDVLVWSFQLSLAKPDPAIYLYVLAKLGTLPEETLFLDDKPVNIEAALALGMKAIEFSTVEQLRRRVAAAGLIHSISRICRRSAYEAIPSPTRLAAAIITSTPAHSRRTGLLSTPFHSPSARPTSPAHRT